MGLSALRLWRHRAPSLLLGVAVAQVLAPPSTAQLCTSGPPTGLGTVTHLGTLPYTGPLPRSTTHAVFVDCQGLPLVAAQVDVSEPPPGVPVRGTILFATGALGLRLYASEPFGIELMRRLQGLGFRVVDRAWAPGWFDDQLSLRRQSCRSATLMRWVYDTFHTTGAFCASGLSAGASEIGYSLTTWGAGDYLDVAVFDGGPSMSRLDYTCPNPPTAGWPALCQSLAPANGSECTQVNCTRLTELFLCTRCSRNPTLQELREDSILHTGAVTSFARTRVHIIIGARDCTVVVPSSILFYNAVTTEKVIEFLPGGSHIVLRSPGGVEALQRALLGGAACRNAPSTLTNPAWPRLGGSLDLAVHGRPGDPFFVVMDVGTAMFEIPGLGWFFLNPAFTPLGGGQLDPVTGLGTFRVAVPRWGTLTGFEVYAQAVVGTCLSNVPRFEFLP